MVGYDASGHMSEETTSADFSAAVGVVLSCGLSAIVGKCLVEPPLALVGLGCTQEAPQLIVLHVSRGTKARIWTVLSPARLVQPLSQ